MQQGAKRALETGGWAVGIGIVEYVTTSTDVEQWLDSLMPHQLVPLVAIVLGALGLAVRVYRHQSDPMPTVDEPAPAELQTVRPDPGQAPASAAPATTPQEAPSATTGAADAPQTAAPAATVSMDGPTPAGVALPELRDPAAAAAVAASVGIPAEYSWPAAVEPTSPPTAFIPLPR